MGQAIDNSKIDPMQVITITFVEHITGSKGRLFHFLPFRQYVMCGEVDNVDVGCEPCKQNDVALRDYYKVCLDDEIFLVPKKSACIEGMIRTEDQQWLHRNWINRNVDETKDYKAAAKEILGREINTGNPDIANQEETNRYKQRKGKQDGRSYGSTSDDGEPNQ